MNQHKLGVLVKLVVALYALAYFGAGVALVGSGVPLEQALGLVLATLAIYSAAGLVALHRSPGQVRSSHVDVAQMEKVRRGGGRRCRPRHRGHHRHRTAAQG